MEIQDPGNTHVINEMYVFVSRDDDGNEGVVAVGSSMGMMPLIAADKERLKYLIPIARDMVGKSKKKIVLLRFHTREEVEVIG